MFISQKKGSMHKMLHISWTYEGVQFSRLGMQCEYWKMGLQTQMGLKLEIGPSYHFICVQRIVDDNTLSCPQ